MEAQTGGTHWTFGADDVDDLERVGKLKKESSISLYSN